LLKVLRDEELISKAREVALEMISNDAKLSKNEMLSKEVAKLKREQDISFLDKG
jgi:hypothetical protein